MTRIPIGQAAIENEVSRRTLERWVRNGQLSTIPDPEDGRRRLVDPEAVRQLIRQMPRRRQKHGPLAGSDQDRFACASEPTDIPYRQAVDKALRQVDGMQRRLFAQLLADGVPELTLEELRAGPLGQDLERLVAYVQGRVHEDDRRVRSAIDSVLQVLFWPAATEDYTVPRGFWDTDLGRLLGRAKLRTYKPHELIPIEDAVSMLGVTRPTLYRWLDDRTIDHVFDDRTGRSWIVRHSVEQLKRTAMAMTAQSLMPERALAS